MAHRNQECRVYVGNLPPDIRERELDDLFAKYGRIRDISLKGGRTGAPFAFIEFDDPRDADDAIYGRDGYDFAGGRLRVERPRGGRAGPRDGGGGSRFTGRHSDYRVTVTGIPSGGSWQDLKDWCRDGGLSNVVFTDVRGGEGVVEFTCESDVEKAIKNLDDTKFKSHTGESGYVRVNREGGGGSSRGDDRRSRERDDRRDDRRSRSPRSRSPRSRSRSPRSRSRSGSRGRSPSPRGRSPSPRGRSASPKGRSASPKGRSPSPRRRSGSRGRSPSPRDDRRDD